MKGLNSGWISNMIVMAMNEEISYLNDEPLAFRIFSKDELQGQILRDYLNKDKYLKL